MQSSYVQLSHTPSVLNSNNNNNNKKKKKRSLGRTRREEDGGHLAPEVERGQVLLEVIDQHFRRGGHAVVVQVEVSERAGEGQGVVVLGVGGRGDQGGPLSPHVLVVAALRASEQRDQSRKEKATER